MDTSLFIFSLFDKKRIVIYHFSDTTFGEYEKMSVPFELMHFKWARFAFHKDSKLVEDKVQHPKRTVIIVGFMSIKGEKYWEGEPNYLLISDEEDGNYDYWFSLNSSIKLHLFNKI